MNIEKMIETVAERKYCTRKGISMVFQIIEKLNEGAAHIPYGLNLKSDNCISCRWTYRDCYGNLVEKRTSEADANVITAAVKNGEFALVLTDADSEVQHSTTIDEVDWLNLEEFAISLRNLLEKVKNEGF